MVARRGGDGSKPGRTGRSSGAAHAASATAAREAQPEPTACSASSSPDAASPSPLLQKFGGTVVPPTLPPADEVAVIELRLMISSSAAARRASCQKIHT